MQSIIKLKINHKAQSGRDVPWDLIYLIKKDATKIATRLFKYHLIVEDGKVIKEFLGRVPFTSMETHGMTRADMLEVDFPVDKELSDLVDTKDYALLIPILTKGRSQNSKKLRYFTSKSFRYHLKSEGMKLSYDKNKKVSDIELPDIQLSAGKDLQGSPCLGCSNLHAKLLDNESCLLGSAQCLSKLLIGNGSDFNNKVKGDVSECI